MKIKTNKLTFGDLQPGDVFVDDTGDTLIKVDEVGEGEDKVNAYWPSQNIFLEYDDDEPLTVPTTPDPAPVKLVDLPPGTVFKVNGEYYLKTDRAARYGTVCDCVGLSDGKHATCGRRETGYVVEGSFVES